MALILNIETSTNICSVALAKDGKLIDMEESKEDKTHANKLGVFVEKILKKNQIEIKNLDAFAISKGPGSYTGLRIGVSFVKGICYGGSKKLIAVNTLQSLCQKINKNDFDENTYFVPMIDARRMEVYTAIFNENNEFVKKVSAKIIDENSYISLLKDRKLVFFGNGAEKCKKFISHKNAIFLKNIDASAKSMISLSESSFKNLEFVDIAYFEPFYLKDFIITKSKKKFFLFLIKIK